MAAYAMQGTPTMLVIDRGGRHSAMLRVSRDREHGFQRIVSNDFRGS